MEQLSTSFEGRKSKVFSDYVSTKSVVWKKRNRTGHKCSKRQPVRWSKRRVGTRWPNLFVYVDECSLCESRNREGPFLCFVCSFVFSNYTICNSVGVNNRFPVIWPIWLNFVVLSELPYLRVKEPILRLTHQGIHRFIFIIILIKYKNSYMVHSP